MKIHLIVATDREGGIAKDGRIPWRFSKDMAFFKRTTVGGGRNAILMGRKTWESLPIKPLPDRRHIVISRTCEIPEEDGTTVWRRSIEEALFWCTEHETELDDVFVIGGEQIYSAFMRDFVDILDSLYITRIDRDFKCDQFFLLDDETIQNLGFVAEDEMMEEDTYTMIHFVHFVK